MNGGDGVRPYRRRYIIHYNQNPRLSMGWTVFDTVRMVRVGESLPSRIAARAVADRLNYEAASLEEAP